jgi:CubicO group peptidase (beta-lactamase class C family)
MLSGSVSPGFEPLRDALARQIAAYPGGAAIAAYHRGRKVVDLWGGVRNAKGDAWAEDTMSVSFSTTKGVASTALHMLADRGLVDYDAPVARYWPEFAQQGKGDIRIRHLMCHEAGLYDIRALIRSSDEMLDWEHMVRLLAAAAPAHPPGERNAYHGLTYGFLVGEIVRRVTGVPFPEFVQAEIAKPLGLDGFYVGAPAHELPRIARLHRRPPRPPGELPKRPRSRRASRRVLAFQGASLALRAAGLPYDFRGGLQAALAPHGIGRFDFSDPAVVQACIPAANGVFTARSLARMYACLANGGELDGVRLLSEETLRRATVIQNKRPDHVLVLPMRWRLGYHLVATPRGVSKHAFGHFGFGGSGAFAHPTHNLSFAMTVNSGHGTPLGDLRIVRMAGLALGAVRKR